MEPHKLGRYVVERTLGKGAMGVVYLARDPVIGRAVALKTLTVPSETEEAEEFRQRFLREAQAAGILNHPGIVTVFDAGVDDATGLSFIAMEYIEGRSLRDLQKIGHAFTYSEVARIGATLAAALDYAHQRGVVHRDIKPANIILTSQGQVKITDFGVARLESSNLTATGQFIGTPNYMSPEQVTGAAVDGRSDLFSLAVVLYELLTGTRPFVGASLTEVSYKIVHEPAPIPSQTRKGVPPAFNPIILKLLEKDPEKRYGRGADVARALEMLRRILAGVPGDTTQLTVASPTPSREGGEAATSLTAGPTATRVTIAEPPKVTESSPWKRAIAGRWVALLVAAAMLPPLVVSAVLWSRIDSGPYGGPPPGEPERRHRVAAALREASAALAAGDPAGVERSLAIVWQQAPYSQLARDLQRRSGELRSTQLEERARGEQAQRLLAEGKELLRQERWRDAAARFEAVLEVAPDDPLAREYLDLARERTKGTRARSAAPVLGWAPTPTPAVGGAARLELYFNSPLSAGSVELELDGSRLAFKPFDFSTKGVLGIRRRGAGIVQDAYAVPAGEHRLTVRLHDGESRLLGEQVIPASLASEGRYVVKIELEGERAVPRFTLTAVRPNR